MKDSKKEVTIINNEVRLIPKKKSIKDDFFFGFSLAEFLIVAMCGVIVFVITNMLDRMTAYKYTFSTVILLGFLLVEVPTTQMRFATILSKLIKYLLKRKELYLDLRKNKERGIECKEN